MNDIICKAEMRLNKSKIFVIVVILLFVFSAIFFIPVSSYEEYTLLHEFQNYCNIFGMDVLVGWDGEFPHISGTFPWIACLIPAVLAILMISWRISYKTMIKHCSLQLTNDGVNGNRKYFLSNKHLKLPIEKVDSISIESTLLDKLLGGQTVAIRSASGLIRFLCVRNAEEFVDKTLFAIKSYKENSKAVSENKQQSSVDDELAKIVKLKEMLNSGIITQEEFDAKKTQLLNL